MSIVIVGVTGTVGEAAARACVARGLPVRALVRSRTARLPDGVEAVQGDLEDARSVAAALDGARGALYISPHHPREAELGFGFVAACEVAGVERLVLSAAYRFSATSPVLDGLARFATGLLGPHYRPKLRVERRVRRVRDAVVLMPTNFFQNDDLFRDELCTGVYPQAIGVRPVNAIDVRDIADAAVRAFTDPSLAGGAYPLVGLDAPSGPERAARWAEALRRPVRYAGDDIGAWRRTVAERMSEQKREDFARTLALIQRFGIPVGQQAHATTAALLGRPPRRFADYASECARAWVGAVS